MVTVHFATVTDVKAKLSGVLDGDKVDNQLDAFVANELSVALFAHRALLVEGTTESSVFYGIGDKSSLGSLEAGGCWRLHRRRRGQNIDSSGTRYPEGDRYSGLCAV